ncbi:MAG: hypothetical protein ACRCYR_11365 [Phycicoccus sp.]
MGSNNGSINVSQVDLGSISDDITNTRGVLTNANNECQREVDTLVNNWTNSPSAGAVEYRNHEQTIQTYIEQVDFVAKAFSDSVIDGTEATRLQDMKVGQSFGG